MLFNLEDPKFTQPRFITHSTEQTSLGRRRKRHGYSVPQFPVLRECSEQNVKRGIRQRTKGKPTVRAALWRTTTSGPPSKTHCLPDILTVMCRPLCGLLFRLSLRQVHRYRLLALCSVAFEEETTGPRPRTSTTANSNRTGPLENQRPQHKKSLTCWRGDSGWFFRHRGNLATT